MGSVLPARLAPRLPVVAGSALVAALALTLHAIFTPLLPGDKALLRAVQRADPGPARLLIEAVDLLTSSAGAVLMWAVLLSVFALARWWPAALAMLLLPAAGLVDNAVGLLVHRDRPPLGLAVRVAAGTDADSFPSGHVLGAVLLYGLLFVVAGQIAGRPRRWAVRVLCVVVILTTGPARVWAGAHWPSDVLAGYLYGVALLAAPIAVYRVVTAAGVRCSVRRLPGSISLRNGERRPRTVIR